MGPSSGLSQVERLCEKFHLRCYWCRKICSYSKQETAPRRDWLVNFQKGKNQFSNLVLSCSECFWRRHPQSRPPKPKPKPTPNPDSQWKPRITERRKYPLEEIRFIQKLVWFKTRGTCLYCKNPVSFTFDEAWMIKDHYIPLYHGGPDDHSNLVPACKHCDNLKGNTLPWEFRNRFTKAPLVCFPPANATSTPPA